jgi:hypothetical protein
MAPTLTDPFPLFYSYPSGLSIFWPLNRKVVLLPETIWILSAFPRLKRRDWGEVILPREAITEIWPFELSPQPNKLLF